MIKQIIHVDMDAFYAAVEARDNPDLRGKPLIVGALPHERGVVSTCSYEARVFGVRSAMSIKEAYRLCPDGIYMHPNPEKYKKASDIIHNIWSSYTDTVEYISLDEGFLDVTGSAGLFGGAKSIAYEIKRHTNAETGLTCSVGIGYSKMSAKLASEEKKPDGLFEIPDVAALQTIIMDRNVRIIYGVGPKTAKALQTIGVNTVREVLENRDSVTRLLGNQGKQIILLAKGIDERDVTRHGETDAKSLGKEHTFQQDITDFGYLKDVLRLTAKELSLQIRLEGVFIRTVTLKVTYSDMKRITRSKSGEALNGAKEIYDIAASLLEKIAKRPIRLVGISLSGFSESDLRQLTFADIKNDKKKEALDKATLALERRYGGGVIKTGGEIAAEKRFEQED